MMAGATMNLGVEWIIACLAPGDVAPHPNFNQELASGPELLGLVAQFKWREYQSYLDHSAETEESYLDCRLPAAARPALDTATVMQGFASLKQLSADPSASLGERSAAALIFAAVASELDEPELAISRLATLIDDIHSFTGSTSSSRAIVIAALHQQIALRALEAGRLEEARASSVKATELASDLHGPWDEFPVSQGISWTSSDSQKRIAELIRLNAMSLLVTTGDPISNSWTEIVRAPYPAASIKPMADTLSALSSAIDGVFKRLLPATHRERIIGGDLDIRQLYSSLLNAELVGDQSSIARERVRLGSVLAIRNLESGPEDDFAEAIRLLRQADAAEQLRRVLQLVRMRGPLETLRVETEKLIDVRARQEFVTASDLILIERSADVVSGEYSIAGLKLALMFAQQFRDGRVKGTGSVRWKRAETAIKSASEIISMNDELAMNDVARTALELLPKPGIFADQFTFAALADLTESINWDKVSSHLRREWGRYLDSAKSSDARPIDAIRALKAVGEPISNDLTSQLEDLERAAAILNGLLGSPPSTRSLDIATEVSVRYIETIQRDARTGRQSGYIYSPFAMAAVLATSHDRREAWLALLSAFSDPLVPADNKMEALRVIVTSAAEEASPKSWVAERIDEDTVSSSTKGFNSLFPASVEEYLSLRRNFYLAYGVVPPNGARRTLIRDAGSPDVTLRLGACMGSWLAAQKETSAEWPQVLLLQLSHDQSPLVRNRAARALGYLSTLEELSMLTEIRSRVDELLRESGVAIPLGTLAGLRWAMRRKIVGRKRHLWCRDLVLTLFDHPSRNIRRTARSLLSEAPE